LLLKQLDRSNAVFKIVPAVLTGVMGLLSVGLFSLRAYMYSLLKDDGYLLGSQVRDDYFKLAKSNQKFSAAYWALYFVTVIASGALALMTIMSLRKARKAGGVS
jgi:tellurite resistance protein TehA-like permease